MTRFVNASVMFYVSILLAVAGCSQPPEPRPGVRDISAELRAWREHNTQAISPSVIKLRDGRCLDTAKLPAPWVQVKHTNHKILAIAAPGDEVDIEPYEVPGRDQDFYGNPYDGRVRVTVSGWSRPNDSWDRWWFIAPARAEELIRSGRYQPKDLWPANDVGLEAFTGYSGLVYFDARRFTQCKHDTTDGQIMCVAIPADEQFRLTVSVSESNRVALPRVLSQLLATVESMRGPCPDQVQPPHRPRGASNRVKL